METKAELIRENKYLSARNDYGLNARLGYPRIMDEIDKQICNAFEGGKNWADENPKPNLVDIDKVSSILKNMITEITYHTKDSISEHYDIDEFIEDFKKAMTEE